jgi:outer membrane protein TolC
MKRYFRRGAAALAAAALLLAQAPQAQARDLSLADAIAQALAANTGLRVTAQDERTAAAELRQAKGQNGFSLTGSGGLDASQSKGEDRTDGLSLKLNGTLPLYTGGKNEARIDAAALGTDIAALTTERAREELKYSVIKAYFDALEARKTIAVDQESADNYQAHLTNVQQLYEAGSKARIDVLRASVELSDARQTLIKAQNSYEVDLATLRNLLNIDRSEPLTLTDDFVYDTFDISLSDCIGYALRSRKDLLADRYTLQQKELAVKEAKAGLCPSVSLSAGTGLSQNAASWNLFDSGVTRAAIDEAEAARDKAALSLEKARQDVDLAVREAYYNMREAEHRMNSTADAVGQAQQDYYIAWEKYRAGEGIMLDVIDAQTALSKARLNEISAQYDYVRCKAQVVDAMGTGLTDSERAAAARLDASVLQQAVAPAGARQDRETKGLAARQAEKQQAAEQPGQAAAKAAEAAGTQQAADAAEAGENARAVAADAQETADDVAGELAGNEGAE